MRRALYLATAVLMLLPGVGLVWLAAAWAPAEEARAARERLAAIYRALDEARTEATAPLQALARAEEDRPYEHYFPYQVPRQAIALTLPLEPSPLYGAPRLEAVQDYVQRDDEGRWSRLFLGQGPPPPGAPPAAGEPPQVACDPLLLRARARLDPLAEPGGDLARTPFVWEETTSRAIVDANLRNPETVNQAILAYEMNDLGNNEMLQAQWRAHQQWNRQTPPPDDPAFATATVRYGSPLLVADESGDPPLLFIARRVKVEQAGLVQAVVLDLARLRADLAAAADLRLAALGARAAVETGPEDASDLAAIPLGPLGAGALVARPAAGPSAGPAASTRAGSVVAWGAGAFGLVLVAGLLVIGALVRQDLAVAREHQRFLASVSHELKAPLAGISALAEMLEGGVSPERAATYAAHILRETRRMARLVENVLAALGGTEARPIGAPPPAPMEPIVRDTVTAMEPVVSASGLAIEVEADPAAPAVAVDPDEVRRVLSNLIDNACKYRDPARPGGTVRVSLLPLPAARARGIIGNGAADAAHGICLAVRDPGIGIPADEIPRLGERFFRGRKALGQGTGGVGLGLAIVREVVEARGGSVHIESAEGRGTTVAVLLPAAPSPPPPGEGAVRAANGG